MESRFERSLRKMESTLWMQSTELYRNMLDKIHDFEVLKDGSNFTRVAKKNSASYRFSLEVCLFGKTGRVVPIGAGCPGWPTKACMTHHTMIFIKYLPGSKYVLYTSNILPQFSTITIKGYHTIPSYQ